MTPEQRAMIEHAMQAAFASAALVWVLSSFARGYIAARHEKDPWWWQGGLRLLCVVAGVCIGLALDATVAGACVGAAGGLLSTAVVGIAKARLRALREGGR